MDTEKEKQLKKLLKGEFLPLFVGLRNELKAINETLAEMRDIDIPEVQKVQVENQHEPIESVEISNLPEVQKVEVLNQQENLADLLVLKTEEVVEETKGVNTWLATTWKLLQEGFVGLKKQVFKVEVKNFPEVIFPKKMDVRITNPTDLKQEKQTFPTSIKINNSEPKDAIPVVLATKDRKKFYEALQAVQQLFQSVNDVNLDGVKRLLEDIKENTANIILNADTININVDDLEELAGKVLRQAFGEATVSSTITESTLASFIVPTGKFLRVKGIFVEGNGEGIFRLYVAGAKKWQGRNAWTERSLNATQEISASAGETVALKVVNTKTGSHDYSGSFYGYELF